MPTPPIPSLFATVSLSFDDSTLPDDDELTQKMATLGLSRHLVSTEGDSVELPRYVYAGQIEGPGRQEIHRSLHRGVNAVLRELALHGRFFIETSLDQDWSGCHF